MTQCRLNSFGGNWLWELPSARRRITFSVSLSISALCNPLWCNTGRLWRHDNANLIAAVGGLLRSSTDVRRSNTASAATAGLSCLLGSLFILISFYTINITRMTWVHVTQKRLYILSKLICSQVSSSYMSCICLTCFHSVNAPKITTDQRKQQITAEFTAVTVVWSLFMIRWGTTINFFSLYSSRFDLYFVVLLPGSFHFFCC